MCGPNNGGSGGQLQAVGGADDEPDTPESSSENRDSSETGSSDMCESDATADEEEGEQGISDDTNPLHIDGLCWVEEPTGVTECFRDPRHQQ